MTPPAPVASAEEPESRPTGATSFSTEPGCVSVVAVPVLSHREILELHAAVVSARLAGSRVALLAGLDAALVASLPQAAAPSEQILADLDALNGAGRLADGMVPLDVWLRNAAALTGSRGEAEIFRRMHQATGKAYGTRDSDKDQYATPRVSPFVREFALTCSRAYVVVGRALTRALGGRRLVRRVWLWPGIVTMLGLLWLYVGVPATGVAVCDEYIKKYSACTQMLPPTWKEQATKSFKERASTANGKTAMEMECKVLLAQLESNPRCK